MPLATSERSNPKSVKFDETNLDSTTCYMRNVALGTQSKQSLRLLHLASLGLLRGLRLPSYNRKLWIEELKKAAYFGFEFGCYKTQFPRSTPPCRKLPQRASRFHPPAETC